VRRNNAASILTDTADAWSALRALPRPERRRIAACAGWILSGTVAFAQPLVGLVKYASESPLNSHTPLIPLVTGYLLFIQRKSLPAATHTSLAGTLLMVALGVAALSVVTVNSGSLSPNDVLSLQILAYVAYLAAGGFLFLGRHWMAQAAFPMSFLVFMVPLPDVVVMRLEDALVLASADVAAWMLKATGTPVLRNGTIFTLPTITLEVARECSGIRSSWVLFITSLVASHMFLKSPWRSFVLVAFVIPLGILRNGFRILVISLLCVNVGPHMIDSVIHHRGGPIFFALSLPPLFLLLWWLRRRENRS